MTSLDNRLGKFCTEEELIGLLSVNADEIFKLQNRSINFDFFLSDLGNKAYHKAEMVLVFNLRDERSAPTGSGDCNSFCHYVKISFNEAFGRNSNNSDQ